MKRIVRKIIAIIIATFAVYNVLWFTWSHVTYGKFSGGLEEDEFSNFVIPHYFCMDEDSYNYAVKYPDYLHFTGNMSVGLPVTEEQFFTDSLIIWPKLSGGYEFGALLYDEDGIAYQIYIDYNGKALSKEDEGVISRHSDNISTLLKKADEKWHIRD